MYLSSRNNAELATEGPLRIFPAYVCTLLCVIFFSLFADLFYWSYLHGGLPTGLANTEANLSVSVFREKDV